jgi:DNA-binding transcriptional regulator LsrR (DeoR family)
LNSTQDITMHSAERIVHKAAWLYYMHGLRQDEVAKQLGISRASVATYLKRARETGIVNISTSTMRFRTEVLARQIEDMLGLTSAWVVAEGGHALDVGAEIPVVAASALLENISAGSRIGVAWGKTVYHIADVLPFADLQGATVLQLCGNLGAPYSYRPDQCTMEIARRLNAEGINLYAPLVLTTVELADALRREPVIETQLNGIADCDIVLYSVGGCGDDNHIVQCGALTPAQLGALRGEGAEGVIAGQIIDGNGRMMDCDYNRRVISADIDTIRKVPIRMMVVLETMKLEPLVAALRGGLVSHLVTTQTLAEALIERGREAILGD